MRKKRLLTISLLMMTLLFSGCKKHDVISGYAEITDGDTIKIDGERIRLTGIDAPEIKQHCFDGEGKEYECGVTSRVYLYDIIDGDKVECKLRGTDRYGRHLGQCFMSDNKYELNREMVYNGWAVSYYTEDYVGEEIYARRNKIGLWAGEFIRPADWRQENARR